MKSCTCLNTVLKCLLSEHLSRLSLSNCVIIKNYQCLEVGNRDLQGESARQESRGNIHTSSLKFFEDGLSEDWAIWRLFSPPGNWSVNALPSRWLPEGKPLPLPESSRVIYSTSQRGNWDPFCFHCFVVSSRAQPECGAAVSPLLLWGIPHHRSPQKRGSKCPPSVA